MMDRNSPREHDASRDSSSEETGAAALRAAPNVGRPADGLVDLRPLKGFVHRLSAGHPAREVILAEPDMMRVAEYAAKIDVWFRLLQLGRGGQSHHGTSRGANVVPQSHIRKGHM